MTTETDIAYWTSLDGIGNTIVAGLTRDYSQSQDDGAITAKMESAGFTLDSKTYARVGEHGFDTDYSSYTLVYSHPNLSKFEIRADSGMAKVANPITYRRDGHFLEAQPQTFSTVFKGRTFGYNIDKPSWFQSRLDDAAPYLYAAAAIVATAFGQPEVAAAIKTGQGLDAGKSLDSAAGSAATSYVMQQAPGVVDNMFFTDSLASADVSDFSIEGGSFDTGALTNPVLAPNLETVSFGVDSPVLDVTPLTPIDTVPAMNQYMDYDITADEYSASFDNVDFSSGENTVASTDAQNVNFGFTPQLTGNIEHPVYGDGSYSSIVGPLPDSGGTVIYGDTPDTLVSDFGSVPYANPPASGSIFTAANMKVATDIGKAIVSVAVSTPNGGGGKFAITRPQSQAPVISASGGLNAQREVAVSPASGQLQPGRNASLPINPMIIVAGGVAALIYLTTKGKK